MISDEYKSILHKATVEIVRFKRKRQIDGLIHDFICKSQERRKANGKFLDNLNNAACKEQYKEINKNVKK